MIVDESNLWTMDIFVERRTEKRNTDKFLGKPANIYIYISIYSKTKTSAKVLVEGRGKNQENRRWRGEETSIKIRIAERERHKKKKKTKKVPIGSHDVAKKEEAKARIDDGEIGPPPLPDPSLLVDC